MSQLPSFYTPSLELARLMLQIEAAEGEITPEVEAALALNEQNVATRTAGLLDLREAAQANVALAQQKKAQADAFQKANERFIERIDKGLLGAVQQFGPLAADTRKVTLGKSEAVELTDAKLIPHALRHPIVVPEAGTPDKAAIKKAIKAGQEVPGAYIETRYKAQIK